MRASHAIPTALALLSLVAAAPALAQARCKAMAEPEVRVDFSPPRPTVDALPMAELRRQGRAGLGEHQDTLGLYKAELNSSMKVEFNMAGDDKTACIRLRNVVVEFQVTERQIYVAKELRRGTCRYEATLAHEQQHARIDDTLFARELPTVKAALTRAALENGVVGPVPVGDLPAHRADIAERMQRILRQELDRLGQVRQRDQGAIDTPESYRREAARCPGE